MALLHDREVSHNLEYGRADDQTESGVNHTFPFTSVCEFTSDNDSVSDDDNNNDTLALLFDSCKNKDEERPRVKRFAGLGLFLILLKNILAGFNDILVKDIHNLQPMAVIFIEDLLMFSLLLPVSIVRDQGPFPPGESVGDRLLLVVMCVIGTAKVRGEAKGLNIKLKTKSNCVQMFEPFPDQSE